MKPNLELNPKLRKALLIILLAVFAISLWQLVSSLLDYREGDQVNAEADALIELPDFAELAPPEPAAEADADPAEPYIDPYADALAAMDFAALRQVNSEVMGWIIIPDTGISYPLMHHANNQYYLSHNWKGGASRVGSIFLEATNSRSLGDFNTIVYGHRMNNGSMFTPLQKFQKQDFWAAHPSVYITCDAGSLRYDIFAAYEVSTEGMTYSLGFSGDKAKQRFIDFCLEQSVIDTGVVPEVQDYILTLSTCTGHGHATRWVVQAVRRGEKPEQQPEQSEQPPEQAPENPSDGDTGKQSENPPDNQQENTADTGNPPENTGDTDIQPKNPADSQQENTGNTSNQPENPTDNTGEADIQPEAPPVNQQENTGETNNQPDNLLANTGEADIQPDNPPDGDTGNNQENPQ